VHVGEEDHTQPGWTTSRHRQDSPWKSQSEWQRTEINGESTFMVWPNLGSRMATVQQNDVASMQYMGKLISRTATYVIHRDAMTSLDNEGD